MHVAKMMNILCLCVCRLWDVRSGSCVQSLVLESMPSSIELSRDRNTVTVAHGTTVTFIDSDR